MVSHSDHFCYAFRHFEGRYGITAFNSVTRPCRRQKTRKKRINSFDSILLIETMFIVKNHLLRKFSSTVALKNLVSEMSDIMEFQKKMSILLS